MRGVDAALRGKASGGQSRAEGAAGGDVEPVNSGEVARRGVDDEAPGLGEDLCRAEARGARAEDQVLDVVHASSSRRRAAASARAAAGGLGSRPRRRSSVRPRR